MLRVCYERALAKTLDQGTSHEAWRRSTALLWELARRHQAHRLTSRWWPWRSSNWTESGTVRQGLPAQQTEPLPRSCWHIPPSNSRTSLLHLSQARQQSQGYCQPYSEIATVAARSSQTSRLHRLARRQMRTVRALRHYGFAGTCTATQRSTLPDRA